MVLLLSHEVEGLWSLQGASTIIEVKVERVERFSCGLHQLKLYFGVAKILSLRRGDLELNWIHRTRKIELVEFIHGRAKNGESGIGTRHALDSQGEGERC